MKLKRGADTAPDFLYPCLSLGSINKQFDKPFDELFFNLFQTNYTDLGEFKVYRGKKNYKDTGRVVSFNGETGKQIHVFIGIIEIYEIYIISSLSIEMNTWDEDECNTYVGTDSTIFPAFMSKDDGWLL